MSNHSQNDHSQHDYEGLLALLQNEFPKTCPRCQRCYATMEAFVEETLPVRQGTGLMGYETGNVADRFQHVLMARNCPCGSTMAAFCCDRRDSSDAGANRRKIFENLLSDLRERGIDAVTAREQLLAFLRGEPSSILKSLAASPQSTAE